MFETYQLSAIPAVQTASSGEIRSKRSDRGDLVVGRLKTSSVRKFGGFRRHAAR